MTHRPRPLPIVAAPPSVRAAELAALPARPFRVADARANGVAPRVLRRSALATPFRGARSRDLAFETRVEAALALAPAGSLASHRTAARLHGLLLPRDVSDAEPVHLLHPTDARRPRHRGIVAHAGAERREAVHTGAVRLTSAEDTWADLSGELEVHDLVAVADQLVARARGRARLADAADRATLRRTRGRAALRQALALTRPGSRSRMESVVRAHLVLAGLTEPEINANVLDESGEWVAQVDFLWPDHRVIAEFQGREFHLGTRRDADEVRRHLLTDHGYGVVFLTAAMFATPAARRRTLTHLAGLLGVPPSALATS